MKRHVAVGVIGHVDHGKTSLVKALTGKDTDCLKEEKERGMSIVLGFAHLDFDEGMVDLIDVPGHEHFVRTMVSGATGIDAAMLVIDIHEGVKPQTVEHLAITQLLGMQRGIVVLTKADRADAEERLAALGRIRQALKHTYLEQAPVVFTSAASGEGIADAKAALQALLLQPAATNARGGRFYLPVDRCFSMPGRGTIVTGTLRGGMVQVGDEVEIMPGGLRASVRQLQCHNQEVERASAGQRVGINLRHVQAGQIARGDTLAAVGLLQTGTLVDVDLHLLASLEAPLQNGQRVSLLFGTIDVPARVRLLEANDLAPGARGLAQLRTARPVACAAGEPFILRRLSPATTIGGGRLLAQASARHRRGDATVLARLRTLAQGDADQARIEQVRAAGYAGMPLSLLVDALDEPHAEKVPNVPDAMSAMSAMNAVTASLPAALARHCAIVGERTVLYRPLLESLAEMIVAAVEKFHRQSPTRRGVPIASCRAGLPRTVSDATFRHVLAMLQAACRVGVQDGLLCRLGYDPLAMLSEEDRMLAASIETAFRDGGATPPDLAQVTQAARGEDPQRRERLVYLLIDAGRLLALDGQLPGQRIVFHRDAVAQARQAMQRAFSRATMFTVGQVRELLDSSRKFTVPLLEHFDAVGYTRRRGDHRVLAQSEHGGE